MKPAPLLLLDVSVGLSRRGLDGKRDPYRIFGRICMTQEDRRYPLTTSPSSSPLPLAHSQSCGALGRGWRWEEEDHTTPLLLAANDGVVPSAHPGLFFGDPWDQVRVVAWWKVPNQGPAA